MCSPSANVLTLYRWYWTVGMFCHIMSWQNRFCVHLNVAHPGHLPSSSFCSKMSKCGSFSCVKFWVLYWSTTKYMERILFALQLARQSQRPKLHGTNRQLQLQIRPGLLFLVSLSLVLCHRKALMMPCGKSTGCASFTNKFIIATLKFGSCLIENPCPSVIFPYAPCIALFHGISTFSEPNNSQRINVTTTSAKHQWSLEQNSTSGFSLWNPFG